MCVKCGLELADLFMATPHKARLTAWRRICLHLFRHLAQKFLAGRQPSGVISIQSDEKSDCAPAPPALCGIALSFCAWFRSDNGLEEAAHFE